MNPSGFPSSLESRRARLPPQHFRQVQLDAVGEDLRIVAALQDADEPPAGVGFGHVQRQARSREGSLPSPGRGCPPDRADGRRSRHRQHQFGFDLGGERFEPPVKASRYVWRGVPKAVGRFSVKPRPRPPPVSSASPVPG